VKVLFVARGYPGLGRVMGSVALDGILRSARSDNYESLFASYISGYTYLVNANHNAINLYPSQYYYRPNAYCNPFGEECEILVQALKSLDIYPKSCTSR